MTIAKPLDAEPPSPTTSRAFRRYALTLLMVMSLFNFLDRQIVNILAEDIKHELGLADWQIGVMTGFAFALFYTMFGLPIARLAERSNRPWIIAASLATWSSFTALAGLAQNYAHLLVARVGVGIGEAGGHPAATSLITDYTPREERASAIAFFHLGVPLGTLVGLAMGGVVADLYGWRAAFFVAGLPGLLVALLVATTLREPRRRMVAALRSQQEKEAASIWQSVRYLGSKQSFRMICLGAALKAFIGFGHAPFTAAFFLRAHRPELTELAGQFGLQATGFLGIAMGVIGGLFGMLGAYAGGQLADRAAAEDLRGYGAIPAIAALVALPFSIAVITVPSVPLAFAMMAAPAFLGALWYGPVHATAQSVAPPHMRATATAIMLFTVNLIGLGLGPLTVGAMSDLFAHGLGLGSADGVRWALIVSAFLAIPTAALFWASRRTVRADFEG